MLICGCLLSLINNGLRIQFGISAKITSRGSVTVTFPISFTNTSFVISLGTWAAGTGNLTAEAIGIATAKTKTGLTLASQSTDN